MCHSLKKFNYFNFSYFLFFRNFLPRQQHQPDIHDLTKLPHCQCNLFYTPKTKHCCQTLKFAYCKVMIILAKISILCPDSLIWRQLQQGILELQHRRDLLPTILATCHTKVCLKILLCGKKQYLNKKLALRVKICYNVLKTQNVKNFSALWHVSIKFCDFSLFKFKSESFGALRQTSYHNVTRFIIQCIIMFIFLALYAKIYLKFWRFAPIIEFAKIFRTEE